MAPQLPGGTPQMTPAWAALTIVGLGIFAVILGKEAWDIAKGQGWIQ